MLIAIEEAEGGGAKESQKSTEKNEKKIQLQIDTKRRQECAEKAVRERYRRGLGRRE